MGKEKELVIKKIFLLTKTFVIFSLLCFLPGCTGPEPFELTCYIMFFIVVIAALIFFIAYFVSKIYFLVSDKFNKNRNISIVLSAILFVLIYFTIMFFLTMYDPSLSGKKFNNFITIAVLLFVAIPWYIRVIFLINKYLNNDPLRIAVEIGAFFINVVSLIFTVLYFYTLNSNSYTWIPKLEILICVLFFLAILLGTAHILIPKVPMRTRKTLSIISGIIILVAIAAVSILKTFSAN